MYLLTTQTNKKNKRALGGLFHMKNIFLTKTLIAIGVFINTTLILGTLFWAIGSSSWPELPQYLAQYSIPSGIFITLPLLFGMWYTTNLELPNIRLLVKLLTVILSLSAGLYMLVWMDSEPKPPNMEFYKNACIITIPMACMMCTIGHYISKYFWKRIQAKKIIAIIDAILPGKSIPKNTFKKY
jgi:hypothetical protein